MLFDGFSGSGCVARLFKEFATKLYANDLEDYSDIVNRCYLSNLSGINLKDIHDAIDYLNAHKLDADECGFIETHYAPRDDDNVKSGERVFYTRQNARIIDNIRRMVDDFDDSMFVYLVAPLLIKASIHVNTSGVFKGFHKKDGLGHFGGKGENALTRIKCEIELDYPIFSDRECEVEVKKGDINVIVNEMPEVDIVYYDPPYNQHPYGSNYFMLNLIANADRPEIQTGVSGITKEWNRSAYNKRKESAESLDGLIESTKAKYILLSYNNEGFIPTDRVRSILQKYGDVTLNVQDYNTYRGSRNLRQRDIKVEEQLWVIKKH